MVVSGDAYRKREICKIFAEVVADALSKRDPFDDLAASAMRVHLRLLKENSVYSDTFSKIAGLDKQLGESKLIEKLEYISDSGNNIRGHLKAAALIIPQAGTLIKGHWYTHKMTSIAWPYLDKAIR